MKDQAWITRAYRQPKYRCLRGKAPTKPVNRIEPWLDWADMKDQAWITRAYRQPKLKMPERQGSNKASQPDITMV